MTEALVGLRRTCARVRFLGSYPRADGAPQRVPKEAAVGAYESARSWVAALLAGSEDADHRT